MDKLVKLFCSKLESMCIEYKNKIYLIPFWQLNDILPNEMKDQTIEKKVDYLIEIYKTSNPIYLLLNDDLNLMQNRNVSFNEFKSLNIDTRYLESIGFKEKQIADYYEFVEKSKSLF